MVANKKRFTLDLDPDFQKRLKVAAALKGISMRQYCLAAIEAELAQENGAVLQGRGLTKAGLDRLTALRDEIFSGKRLPGDSADLIREERELRTKELERRSGS